MGLYVDVFTNGRGDCTNGGVSSRFRELCVVNVDGPFDPKPDAPAVALVDGPSGTKRVVVVMDCAEPGEEREWQQVTPGGSRPMFGGNYAASSDGRWTREVGFYGAVAIHDRFEWENVVG